MRRGVNSIIVAAYLLLCILLGGSAQGIWTNLALQLFGIALVAWAAIAAEPAEEGPTPTMLYLLLGFAGLFVLLQLIPMPATMWTELPNRSDLADGLAVISGAPPPLPISETPYRSVMTLFAVIPSLALFVAVKLLRPSPRWLVAAILTGMTLSIALGALQVTGGRASWAYLYPITNTGAVGVFANSNHMAMLLLISIPFAAALLASSKGNRSGSVQGRWTAGLAVLILIAVGITLNGSLAAIGLALPVLLASSTLFPTALRWRGLVLPFAGVALFGGIAVLATTPITTYAGAETSAQSRQQIWGTTLVGIRDSFPTGTGLGSFEEIYRQYEDPTIVTREYVNHAHNDYLELTLELGAPGILLITLFLGWWILTAVRVWTSPLSTPFVRAATIASAAILAHSVFDYPLRTAAISAIFGVAIALMAQRLRSESALRHDEWRPSRHVRLG